MNFLHNRTAYSYVICLKVAESPSSYLKSIAIQPDESSRYPSVFPLAVSDARKTIPND
jgi:hypothetical protein